jgi:hypothetical protein
MNRCIRRQLTEKVAKKRLKLRQALSRKYILEFENRDIAHPILKLAYLRHERYYNNYYYNAGRLRKYKERHCKCSLCREIRETKYTKRVERKAKLNQADMLAEL